MPPETTNAPLPYDTWGRMRPKERVPHASSDGASRFTRYTTALSAAAPVAMLRPPNTYADSPSLASVPYNGAPLTIESVQPVSSHVPLAV